MVVPIPIPMPSSGASESEDIIYMFFMSFLMIGLGFLGMQISQMGNKPDKFMFYCCLCFVVMGFFTMVMMGVVGLNLLLGLW